MRTSANFIISSLQLCLLLLALNLVQPETVSAQDLDKVTITGRVLDQNRAYIPGAKVEAVLVNADATRTSVTDDEGRYHIIQLEPGVYNLLASSTGFAPLEKKELSF